MFSSVPVVSLQQIIREEKDAKLAQKLHQKQSQEESDYWDQIEEAERLSLAEYNGLNSVPSDVAPKYDSPQINQEFEEDEEDDYEETDCNGEFGDYFVERQKQSFSDVKVTAASKSTNRNTQKGKSDQPTSTGTTSGPDIVTPPPTYADVSTSCGRVYKNRIPRPITVGASKTRVGGNVEVEKNTGVPGLFLVYNFISPDLEQSLLASLEPLEWHSNRANTRRVQLYVPWHENPKFCITAKPSSPELPPDAVALANSIVTFGRANFPQFDWDEYKIYDRKNTELQVNEYGMADALGFHKDNVIAYREIVFGISLLSDCWIHYQYLKEEVKVLIPRRSLYLLSGAARYKWKHGIPPDSLVNGDRRVSLTYRQVSYTRRMNVK